MAKFNQVLAENKMTLVVSLPKNSVEMAKAAADNGAQAIKMHINVSHRASGNHFGSLQEELATIEQILATVDVPVGLVPGGADAFITQAELGVIEDLGIDFFSVYSSHMPPFLSETKKLTRMVAIDHTVTDLELQAVNVAPMDVLEVSLMPSEAYGSPLNFQDILKYAGVISSINKPVLIPTQKAIKPQEVSVLSSIGVKAIMIGAVVTTQEIGKLAQVTAEFSREIAKL